MRSTLTRLSELPGSPSPAEGRPSPAEPRHPLSKGGQPTPAVLRSRPALSHVQVATQAEDIAAGIFGTTEVNPSPIADEEEQGSAMALSAPVGEDGFTVVPPYFPSMTVNGPLGVRTAPMTQF
jgi:hypothetical protein